MNLDFHTVRLLEELTFSSHQQIATELLGMGSQISDDDPENSNQPLINTVLWKKYRSIFLPKIVHSYCQTDVSETYISSEECIH